MTAVTDGALLALDGADFLELVNAGPLVRPRLLDLHRGAPARAPDRAAPRLDCVEHDRGDSAGGSAGPRAGRLASR